MLWAGLTAALAAILVLLLMLFIMPSLKSGPHDLAIGIVGEPAAVAQVASALDAQSPGAFDVQPMQSAAALESAIRDRSLAGGFDLGGPDPTSVEVFVASAGSTAISGTLTATGTALAEAMQREAHITDVVALPAADPTGVGIGGLAFTLVFGGIVPLVAYRSVLSGRRGWIKTGLLGFSLVGGTVVAAVLRFMFGSIEQAFWPVAGAVALGIAALALPLAGLNECFGGKGFTIGAMAMMFLGNPFAGIATSAAWLPAGVAAIGQILPPGAAGTLVRAVAYFDGAGGGVAALTLGLWALAGHILWTLAPRMSVAGRQSRRPATQSIAASSPAAARNR